MLKGGIVFLKKNLTRKLPARELRLFFSLFLFDLRKIEVHVGGLPVRDLVAISRDHWLRIDHRAAEHAL